MPDLAGGRLTIGTYARQHNYPQEDFFGIGPDSLPRRSLELSSSRTRMVGARVGVKPAPIATFGGGVEYHAARSWDAGRNRALPSIDERFDDTSHPDCRARATSFARARFSTSTTGNRRTPGRAAGTGSRPAASPSEPTRSRSIASMRISVSTRASSQNVACSRCACSSRPPTLRRERACRSI